MNVRTRLRLGRRPRPPLAHARVGAALAVTTLAAIAMGAVAVGALAIGALAIGEARIRRLRIDELVVGGAPFRAPG